ncbi:AI-2 transport protein TqsA [Bremerella volcania]|uniref:AI-2 transport protein TqsA n=1 Tax=Bremerella volcania TaxID=2527984 RepID=A0A518CAJ0_9BACT|nr:AI-2E family transporter [Bremerella volcania]QDU76248.1 AI-2 transport protein TqsA [Bremerella volcania]
MNQEGLSVKKLTEEQSWLQTGALLVLAFIAFSFGLMYARAVLVPFTLALFLNYLVAPIVDFQMIRLKFSKFISVTLTLLLVVLVLVLMSFLVTTVIQNVTTVANDKTFMAKFERRLEGPLEAASKLMDRISGLDEGDKPPFVGSPDATPDGSGELSTEDAVTDDPMAGPDDVGEPLVTDDESMDSEGEPNQPLEEQSDDVVEGESGSLAIPVAPRNDINRTQQLLRTLVAQIRQESPQLATQAGATLLNLISSTVLTSIFVGFMLAGRDPYKVSKGIYAEIDRNVRKYIATKFFISAITGLLVWGCLAMIGMQFASMFGLIAFCLNFIPSIGSIIATLLPIPIAIVQFDSALMITLAIVLPGAVQMTMGNVIEPKIMGDGLQLHPATILLALAFFGMLWGPVGMLLAAPITAIVRIVLMRFKTTEPIGRLMAGVLPEEEDHLHHV